MGAIPVFFKVWMIPVNDIKMSVISDRRGRRIELSKSWVQNISGEEMQGVIFRKREKPGTLHMFPEIRDKIVKYIFSIHACATNQLYMKSADYVNRSNNY